MREKYKKWIMNRIVRKKAGRVYYFDNNLVYQSMPLEQVIPVNFHNVYAKGETWDFENVYASDLGFSYSPAFMSEISKLKEGETIDMLEKRILAIPDTTQKPQGLDRFITKIEAPVFIRSNDNPNPNTFDYIYVDINVIKDWEDRVSFIKKNIEEIKKRALIKVRDSKKFQKFGVSINFLKIARITLIEERSILELVWELKEV